MHYIQFLTVFVSVILYSAVCVDPPKYHPPDKRVKDKYDLNPELPPQSDKIPMIDLSKSHATKQDSKAISNIGGTKNLTSSASIANNNSSQIGNSSEHTSEHSLPKSNATFEDKTSDIESGAITRGILVFVGVSLLFILYVAIKTYRRRKQDKSKIIVRKYGVRTNRSDVEMEPLPLSDDEEDETVFDLTASRRSIH